MTAPAQHGLNPSVHVATGSDGTILLTFQRYHSRTGVSSMSIELNRRTAKRFAKDVLQRLSDTLPPRCRSCGQRKRRS